MFFIRRFCEESQTDFLTIFWKIFFKNHWEVLSGTRESFFFNLRMNFSNASWKNSRKTCKTIVKVIHDEIFIEISGETSGDISEEIIFVAFIINAMRSSEQIPRKIW